MATATTKLLTAEEFFDFVQRPENRGRRFELEDGEIIEMSRPSELHGVVCGNVVWLFGGYVRQIKRGRVCANDTGLLIRRRPDTVRGLDVAVYTESKSYAKLSRKYARELPNVAIEIKSPNDRVTRMVARLNRFLAKGVQLVWLVDPEDWSVMIWRKGQEPMVFEEGDEIANLPELPGFRCRVDELFEVHGD